MFRPMKPETIARRAAARAAERTERQAEHLARLKELALRDGPDSIWAEMFAEAEVRAATAGAR